MASKGYTIQFFINIIKELKETQITSNLYDAIAPRGGYPCLKSQMLDYWLGDNDSGHTLELVYGSSSRALKYGKTAKTRLINALKARQAHGRIW
jgi:hypothetical protein